MENPSLDYLLGWKVNYDTVIKPVCLHPHYISAANQVTFGSGLKVVSTASYLTIKGAGSKYLLHAITKHDYLEFGFTTSGLSASYLSSVSISNRYPELTEVYVNSYKVMLLIYEENSNLGLLLTDELQPPIKDYYASTFFSMRSSPQLLMPNTSYRICAYIFGAASDEVEIGFDNLNVYVSSPLTFCN